MPWEVCKAILYVFSPSATWPGRHWLSFNTLSLFPAVTLGDTMSWRGKNQPHFSCNPPPCPPFSTNTVSHRHSEHVPVARRHFPRCFCVVAPHQAAENGSD